VHRAWRIKRFKVALFAILYVTALCGSCLLHTCGKACRVGTALETVYAPSASHSGASVRHVSHDDSCAACKLLSSCIGVLGGSPCLMVTAAVVKGAETGGVPVLGRRYSSYPVRAPPVFSYISVLFG